MQIISNRDFVIMLSHREICILENYIIYSELSDEAKNHMSPGTEDFIYEFHKGIVEQIES